MFGTITRHLKVQSVCIFHYRQFFRSQLVHVANELALHLRHLRLVLVQTFSSLMIWSTVDTIPPIWSTVDSLEIIFAPFYIPTMLF